MAAGIIAILDSRADGEWSALVTAAWIADGVVTVLYLLVTVAAWGLYRRRHADLDAAGAEAVGEMHARIANLRRDEPD